MSCENKTEMKMWEMIGELMFVSRSALDEGSWSESKPSTNHVVFIFLSTSFAWLKYNCVLPWENGKEKLGRSVFGCLLLVSEIVPQRWFV